MLPHNYRQVHWSWKHISHTCGMGCRYAETVIYRMFYSLDRTMTGRLTLRDLRRCAPTQIGLCRLQLGLFSVGDD